MRCRVLDPYGRVVLKRRRKNEGGFTSVFPFCICRIYLMDSFAEELGVCFACASWKIWGYDMRIYTVGHWRDIVIQWYFNWMCVSVPRRSY